MKIILTILLVYLIGNLFFISSTEVSADTFLQGLKKTAQEIGYKGSDSTNPPALPQTIGKLIGGLLAFIGVIFLGLMIYGGYTWMMARGNEQEATKAKDMIRNAIIGLIIVLAAYGITTIVTILWVKV